MKNFLLSFLFILTLAQISISCDFGISNVSQSAFNDGHIWKGEIKNISSDAL
jgi:hypothetical protein